MRPLNQDVIRAIKNCIQNNMNRDCACISVRSIAAETGIPFPSVARYLQKFVASGEVKADDEYGYVLTHNAGKINQYRAVSVVGSISCGTLNIAEQDVTEYLKLPSGLVSDGEYFLLRSSGESMINIGIEPGDLVLIRKQDYAEPGQVTVVISTEFSDAGGTLKRYYPEPQKNRIRLHPENGIMEDFYITNGIVQGVAKKVIKVRDID